MAEKVQMNYLVLPETKDRVKEIARLTFRDPGGVLDWLVAEVWKKFNKPSDGEQDEQNGEPSN